MTHDHHVTLFQRRPIPPQEAVTYAWRCTCGEIGFADTGSIAAQRFAEHYALAVQQAAPKVTRHAPAHDGGRRLDLDTIRKSEEAVILALYFGRLGNGAVNGPLTDHGIAAASRRAIIVEHLGEFSPSRLRTARVEVERAGLVEKRELVQRGPGQRRMQSFALTDSGLRMAQGIVAGRDIPAA
jgi:hypothetical protein